MNNKGENSMGTTINLLVNGQYTKVSAENIVRNIMEFGEETKNNFYSLDRFDFIQIKKHDVFHDVHIIYLAKTLPYLSFNIKSKDYSVINKFNYMSYELKEFLKEFTHYLDSDSSELIIDYFMNKFNVIFSEMQRTNSVQIPVFIEQPIAMLSKLNVKENNIQSISNYLYPILEKSLNLPNQYPDGELCLGKNKKTKSELDKYDFNEDYISFLEGYFNEDMPRMTNNNYLFQNLYNVTKKFAVENLFSDNTELKKVAEKLIEILKKENTSKKLQEYISNVDFDGDTHNNDIFNNSYYYYLLLSLFFNDI